MLQLRIAVRIASLRQPLRRALETARQFGLRAIEIDAIEDLRPREVSQTALRQIRKMLDDYELRVAAVRFLTRRGYSVADGLDRRIAATKEVMQFAYALGAPIVVTQVGQLPESHDPKADISAADIDSSASVAWNLLLEVLSDLGRWSHRAGSLLVAKTGTQDPALLARVLAALPEATLGAAVDPAAVVVGGYSPLEAVSQLGPWLQHVYANDATRDLARGRGVETPLGRGSVDWPAMLGALEEQNYRGYLCIERDAASEPLQEVRQAIQYLHALEPSA